MQQVSKYLICGLLISSCTIGFSQTSNRIFFECKSEILKPGRPLQQLNFSPTPQINSNVTSSFLNPVQSGKRPMFCRMEDNLHKRFNVWIVMRAGSDEEYKKLIDEKDKPTSGKIP